MCQTPMIPLPMVMVCGVVVGGVGCGLILVGGSGLV